MGQYLADIALAGGAKISGLPAATATGQAVNYDQWISAQEGLDWKDGVVAASTVNVTLTAPGATIDGVTLVSGDRILLKNQTSALENGVYIWNGASVAATRAADMNSSTEFNDAIVPVQGGTANGGTQWRQTAINPTVGTTAIAFAAFGTSAPPASESTAGIAEIATQAETDAGTDDLRMVTPLKLKTYAGGAKRYAADVGDGSATSITVTHNLNTRDVQVQVRRNSGSYDFVACDMGAATVNTVVLVFATAPTSAQYRCIVMA